MVISLRRPAVPIGGPFDLILFNMYCIVRTKNNQAGLNSCCIQLNKMTKVLIPNFSKRSDGLVDVVVQDAHTDENLIVASTDRAGFLETLETGELVLFSKSRKKRWKKGEESGHTMKVHDIRIDCDGDALTIKVSQKTPCACHTDARTCFFRRVFANDEFITPAPKIGEKEQLKEEEVEVHPSLLASTH